MIEIKNISTNPLMLSDGKLLAAGECRRLRRTSERELAFAERGWLQIVEMRTDDKSEKPADPQRENGGKK
jgi:hypothetical protein